MYYSTHLFVYPLEILFQSDAHKDDSIQCVSRQLRFTGWCQDCTTTFAVFAVASKQEETYHVKRNNLLSRKYNSLHSVIQAAVTGSHEETNTTWKSHWDCQSQCFIWVKKYLGWGLEPKLILPAPHEEEGKTSSTLCYMSSCRNVTVPVRGFQKYTIRLLTVCET